MNSREQVVVIDDEEAIRSLLEKVFGAEGYSCRTFGSAREALARIDDIVPIAIFVDICMPEMDGMQFMHELRKSHLSVPVVVMTGHSNDDMFRQTLRYHIADFLVKPFGPGVVLESLRKALGRDDSFTEEFLDTVAHRLREARLALGLKQAEVASRCGLSTSQVSQIELRQSSPSVTTLLKLCKAINLTVTELVKGF